LGEFSSFFGAEGGDSSLSAFQMLRRAANAYCGTKAGFLAPSAHFNK
jgi:hypothetical protein